MAEFEIDGKKYRSQPMNAMKSFHLSRRLASLLTSFSEIREGKKGEIEALTDALAGMSDEQANYIINACLSTVEYEDHGRFSPVFTEKDGFQYENMDMVTMISIVGRVVMENLAVFTSAVGRIFPEGAAFLESNSSLFPKKSPG